MGFIVENIYDKKIMKIRQYFGLLIHSKKIFGFLDEVVKKMSHMYENPANKAETLSEEIKPIEFLKDGQYLIMG